MSTEAPFPRMHVSLYVSDMEKTITFYDQFFGQAADKVKHKYAKYILSSPALVISFIENAARVQSNFGHLGIQVETKEEMESKLEIARTQGIVSKEEIGTACCYAVQDKFWAADPDGHQWEVYYFHEDVEFNDPHYALEDTSACCTSEVKEETTKPRISLSTLQDKSSCCEPESGCC